MYPLQVVVMTVNAHTSELVITLSCEIIPVCFVVYLFMCSAVSAETH